MSEQVEKALCEIEARIDAAIDLYERVGTICGGDPVLGRRYAAAQWQASDSPVWADVVQLFEMDIDAPPRAHWDPFDDDSN